MKTISIPTNDRPSHLERVLKSILNCCGNEAWSIVFSCEPNVEVRQLVQRYRVHWKQTLVHENPVQLKCWANTFMAAQCAMSWNSDLNLYLEDDYELSRDTLRLVDAWSQRDDSSRTVLCLRRPHESQDMHQPQKVRLCRSGLFGCGFAWKPVLWPVICETWWRQGAMWDISMESLSAEQWRPLVNRTHGFGVDGTHCHANTDLNLIGPGYDGCQESFTFES